MHLPSPTASSRPARGGHLLLPLVLCCLLAAACQRGAPEPAADGRPPSLTVAAAASLRHVLPALVEAWRAQHPEAEVHVTYGASGALRRQVEAGAPIDAVVLAHADAVDALLEEGHALADTRAVVATNSLVLVGRSHGPPLSFATLPQGLPPGERLAVGEPRTVPAGQYARLALERLGRWEALSGRLVFAGDVAAVLAWLRRGEVAAAIVYRTDVRGLSDVVVREEARGPWAPAPEVVAAAVRPAAAPFVRFLSSEAARAVWAAHGFGTPPGGEAHSHGR